jgi:hypothetical protein
MLRFFIFTAPCPRTGCLNFQDTLEKVKMSSLMAPFSFLQGHLSQAWQFLNYYSFLACHPPLSSVMTNPTGGVHGRATESESGNRFGVRNLLKTGGVRLPVVDRFFTYRDGSQLSGAS